MDPLGVQVSPVPGEDDILMNLFVQMCKCFGQVDNGVGFTKTCFKTVTVHAFLIIGGGGG
jgi:hypothetical protein